MSISPLIRWFRLIIIQAIVTLHSKNKIKIKMIVLIVFSLFITFQVYCSPVQLQEARVKRAVFVVIPSGVVSGEEDRSGSVCECSDF